MSQRLYQRYYVTCLIKEKKLLNYIDIIDKFKTRFKEIEFSLSEDIVRKIKSSIIATMTHYTIEDVCNSLKLDNKDIQIDIYPIKIYNRKNINKELNDLKEQKVIIIGTSNMLKNLDFNLNIQFGVDFTFKIIPNVYKPYKLMTIYYVNRDDNTTNLASLICIKYNDSQSLEKLFSILRATYNFNPKLITTDFDSSLIKALKGCEMFNSQPIIIPCFFHYSQCLVRKFKQYKLIKNKLTKKTYEIL